MASISASSRNIARKRNALPNTSLLPEFRRSSFDNQFSHGLLAGTGLLRKRRTFDEKLKRVHR